MKPYILLEGSADAKEAFEAAIAESLEAGYNFAGDLVVKTSGSSVKFYQPMVVDLEDFEEEDEEGEEEDE